MDDRELAKLLKTAGEDQDFFIGSSSTLNPDGTVTISSEGRSVRAIAQTAFCSGTWSAKRVGNTWYAWSSNAPIVGSESRHFRKMRSHPRQKDKTNDVILLLDSNVWVHIHDLNATTAQTKYKGNIDFFKGIIEQSKAYERKKIYTFSPEGTFFGQPFYEGVGVTYLIQDSVLLTQYVFSPLGIEVIAINDTDINQVDSVLWFPLFVLGIGIGDPSDPDYYFLQMPLQFPKKVISRLTRIAKKFGIILQGEHSAWFAHNNYYLETFNKRYQSDWRFTSTTYPRNWVSQDKESKEAVITTNLTHGMPLNQLDKRMRALATFEWSGVEYAGAIAWKM